ncbi:hypothetical protein D3C74_446140 [compost metagenome]
MLKQIVVGAFGDGEILGFTVRSVSCRKGPENPRIEYKALSGAFHNIQLIVNLADKPAVLLIQGMLHPEAEDIVLKPLLQRFQPLFR